MATATGLCNPTSSSTPVTILAKAARPRRVLAFFCVALTAGVLVTLNCVPSVASKRQPRQKASGWRRRCTNGRKAHCINWVKTCHGKRARRSDQELSAKGA